MRPVEWHNWEKLRKYPHQRPEDIRVIERAIALAPDLFHQVAYDVRVGSGRPVEHDVPAHIAEDWTHLTKLRIDMVGARGDALYVVEVKPSGNPTALGQAAAYCELFNQTFAGYPRALPAILCDGCHPDIKRASDMLGVRIIDLQAIQEGRENPLLT